MNENASDKREYLYVLKVVRREMLTEGPTPEEAELLDRHIAYLGRLAEAGTALLYGRTQTSSEKTIGLVLLAAGSEEEARRRMEEDPAVREGLMRAELFPYRIAGGSLAGGGR